MEVIHDAPLLSSFTPLSEHQSQTPASFYTGKPVLYHHCPNAKLLIPERELHSSPALSKLSPEAPNGTTAGEGGAEAAGDVVIEGLAIWVTSENFLLYSQSKSIGVSIPYPSISLHAIQTLQYPKDSTTTTQGLFLQISTSDGFDDHDPDDTLSMTLIPSPSATSPSTETTTVTSSATPTDAEPEPSTETPIQALFSSLSACANLHPDPMSDDEDGNAMDTGPDGTDGLPPPVPGSGGWITAENMGEFFDEEGNWRGEGLGPGAGRVRTADEVDGEEVNGDGDEEEEGDGDGETKWRRTE